MTRHFLVRQWKSVWQWLREDYWRMAILLVGVLLPLILFGQLAEEIHEGDSFSWDESVLQGIREYSTPRMDQIFATAEHTGSILVMPFLVAMIFALRFLKRSENATFFAFAVGGAYGINLLTKAFFQRERPALWASLAPESNYSFPSGHAMVSMAVAVAFIELAWSTKWRWPVVILGLGSTLLIGFSRLYLGVHYPSDVLAGWSASLIWTSGLFLLLRKSRAKPVAVS